MERAFSEHEFFHYALIKIKTQVKNESLCFDNNENNLFILFGCFIDTNTHTQKKKERKCKNDFLQHFVSMCSCIYLQLQQKY